MYVALKMRRRFSPAGRQRQLHGARAVPRARHGFSRCVRIVMHAVVLLGGGRRRPLGS
jgi:hypothetical protein